VGDGRVSINQDFNQGAGVGGYQYIKLDINPVQGGTANANSWMSINFDTTTQNPTINVAGYGIHFRGNRGYQVFDNGGSGAVVGSPASVFCSTATGTTANVEIRLTTADGNAFDGTAAEPVPE